MLLDPASTAVVSARADLPLGENRFHLLNETSNCVLFDSGTRRLFQWLDGTKCYFSTTIHGPLDTASIECITMHGMR